MKRTTLMLPEDLLHEAQKVTGMRTYTATVQYALEEVVRRAKARKILELEGSGLWHGELSEMRGDRLAETKSVEVADRPQED